MSAHLSKDPNHIMDREQAARLGEHLRTAREAKGLTLLRLAELTGINNATLGRIEAGSFAAPRPDKLARIAEALGTPLADVFSLAEYEVPDQLPSFSPYMRSKYKGMPDEEIDRIERYAQTLARKHGINLAGPANGQDERPSRTNQP